VTARRRLAIDGGEPVLEEFLPFGRPDLGEEEIAAVAEVVRSSWIGMGPRTLEFEEAFADYVGAGHAVALGSCTAALHLALLASDVGPGDEVITSGLTFAATVNAILATGARPVLVDVDRRTLNLDPGEVEAALTERTRAILPVHFGGLACDMAALGAIAERHDLRIVEDAAHAVGAEVDGARIGALGHAACFSFYPNKNMTTGEGGMVTVEDPAVADALRELRLHGLGVDGWKRYAAKQLVPSVVIRHGWKYNMTDLQAALGLVQLRRLDGFQARREEMARRFDEAFADLPVDRQIRPDEASGGRHALHLYVLLPRLAELTVGRDEVVLALRAENVGAAMHYPAMHQHPFYREEMGIARGDLPNADWVTERTLSLPMSPSMSDRDLDAVITATRSVLEHYRRS
jgi:dTDP-4-amino-4,6-dideoxygalactose transaminase